MTKKLPRISCSRPQAPPTYSIPSSSGPRAPPACSIPSSSGPRAPPAYLIPPSARCPSSSRRPKPLPLVSLYALNTPQRCPPLSTHRPTSFPPVPSAFLSCRANLQVSPRNPCSIPSKRSSPRCFCLAPVPCFPTVYFPPTPPLSPL